MSYTRGRDVIAKYPSTCGCGERIETGFNAYWIPANRRMLCRACGDRLKSRLRSDELDQRDAIAAGKRTKPPDESE